MQFPVQSRRVSDLTSLIMAWSRQNWPSIRFCLLFSFFVGGILFFLETSGVSKSLLTLLSTKEAQLTSWFLNLIGIKTQSANAIVFQSQGFAIEITHGCTGIKPLGFFIAGVLAYRCSFANKLRGMVLGAIAIFFTSYVRAISLFMIGIYMRSRFDFLHDVLWEIVMILITFLAWLFWLKGTGRVGVKAKSL